MKSLCGIRRTCDFCRAWTIIAVLLLGLAGGLNTLSWAQIVCGEPHITPIRVEDGAGLSTLRAALHCTGGGEVEVEWAGRVAVAAPIAVGEGTFLSVTGETNLAEVHGSGARLFEVYQGGRLALTRLKLSGGSAAAGGAIHSQSSSVTLDNCVLDGNVATDGSGGAVWADGGNVTIVGGEFLVNTATRYGGAVHATDGRLVVQGGSKFESNTAMAGGAVFCGLSHPGSDEVAVLCSITGAEFVSNHASYESPYSTNDLDEWFEGGGATMFRLADVDITDSVFRENHAERCGGALHGGHDTNVSVKGCRFLDNTSEMHGGAISASSITLGGDTQLTNNSALEYGGAVFGWDSSGTTVFNDVRCTDNSASTGNGGCFYGGGVVIINDGTVMYDNVAIHGGCIYAAEGSDISVHGGSFTCQSSLNGAFLYALDGSRAVITGGVIEGNVAASRAGGVYCAGNTNGAQGSSLLIEGGIFRNNSALVLGGVIVAWGSSLVAITGGEFTTNTARFYGGFAFIEEKASLTCEGATITDNYAGDQGGGIYAREAAFVNSSCNLIANTSPNGAAIYLTNVESANFKNHDVAANLATGGSVVFVAASSVVARKVLFKSGVGLQGDSSNRAIQLDGDSSLNAEECIFDGWRGDTTVHHKNAEAGSLVLDSCDFTRSAATMAVISPNSKAEIRNAVVSSFTATNAVPGTLNNSLTLVDRALDCADAKACGEGTCVDSALGVLCGCLENGECLDDGGELSLSLHTAPATVTISPDPVSYELLVSSASTGTTYAIWKLEFEAEDLDLYVVPSSGVLLPGSSVTVTVSGTPSTRNVGGDLISSFNVASIASASSDATGEAHLDVKSKFYLCPVYQYANPVVGDDNEGFSCEACTSIDESDGVDCDDPGATLSSLPIRKGYWRPSQETVNVRACLHDDTCMGGTAILTSDDYCEEGYRGPYCAVCAEGYGRSLSNTCYACHGNRARLLIIACTVFFFVVVVTLVLAVVFLIGGLDALKIVRQSTIHRLSWVVDRRLDDDGGDCMTSTCCVFGKNINQRAQQLPRNKLKILVGVWQILAVFSTTTGAQFPDSYALFLSWINVLNFDLGYIFKASCILPSLNFYQQLLATTLSPLVVSAGLMLTYRIANGRAGIGSAGVIAKRAARSRHLSAGCFITFLVFTSTSSAVFNTFPCDDNVVDGESYLIVDYSISCTTRLHSFFRAYAGIMIFVYPIGIPALYFVVLWKYRELLNPQIHAGGNSEAGNATERATKTSHGTRGDSAPAQTNITTPKGQSNNESSPLTLEELEERVKARAEHPELAPIMFLWRDFEPRMYYYEVIECGRRIFLTDVLILIRPHTVTQAATGCIFAFLSLLAFELMRPHLDPADTLLYRLGCVLIFLTMFLAMVIKMDVTGEANRSALGIYMVVLNVVMILAVVWTILRHTGDSSGDEK